MSLPPNGENRLRRVHQMPRPQEPMVKMYLVGSEPAAKIINGIVGTVISAAVRYGAMLRISFEGTADHLILMGCFAPAFDDPIEVSPGHTEVGLVSKPTVAVGFGQFNEEFEPWDGEQYMRGWMVSGYSPGWSHVPAGPNNEAGVYPSAILEINSGRFVIVTPFTMEVSEHATKTKPV